VPALLQHAGGLVCLTGALPFGLLPRLLLGTGLRGKTRQTLSLLREALGEEGLYAELTDDRTAGSRRRMAKVEAFARENGVLSVAA
jgi:error-prone DNA polymerase